MPDIILPGSAGRIEARYQRQKAPGAPMALVLLPGLSNLIEDISDEKKLPTQVVEAALREARA